MRLLLFVALIINIQLVHAWCDLIAQEKLLVYLELPNFLHFFASFLLFSHWH